MRRYLPWVILLAALAVGAEAWWLRPRPPDAVAVPAAPPEAPDAGDAFEGPPLDFTLTSAQGPVSLAQFRGKVVLVYFGYTFCPDICPTSLAATARALNSLPRDELDRVQVLFISVDPERDTPARMAEYAGFFHPNIRGVTGTPAQVAEVARLFGARYRRHQEPGETSYSMDHTALTYVVAPDGRFVGRLPHAAAAPLVVMEIEKWLTPKGSR